MKLKERREKNLSAYDSTYNLSSNNPQEFIGQTLIFLPDSKSEERGYYDIKMEYLDSLGHATGARFYPYKIGAMDKEYTDYFTLLDTEMEILEVATTSYFNKELVSNLQERLGFTAKQAADFTSNVFGLILKHPKKDDMILMRLGTLMTLSSLPAVVKGYYEKLKSQEINKSYFLIEGSSVLNLTDGRNVWDVPKDSLRCVDIAFDDGSQNALLILQDIEGTRYCLENWRKNKDLWDVNREAYDTDMLPGGVPRKIRRKYLINKYGESVAYKILGCSLELGFTDTMCKEALGYPDDINTTTIPGVVSEQWVYDDRDMYLYFDNGILTGIQK